jgi:hypothetical protein
MVYNLLKLTEHSRWKITFAKHEHRERDVAKKSKSKSFSNININLNELTRPPIDGGPPSNCVYLV